jgi:hypothetical protein
MATLGAFGVGEGVVGLLLWIAVTILMWYSSLSEELLKNIDAPPVAVD